MAPANQWAGRTGSNRVALPASSDRAIVMEGCKDGKSLPEAVKHPVAGEDALAMKHLSGMESGVPVVAGNLSSIHLLDHSAKGEEAGIE
jgi:hypothetical protein